MIIIIDTVYSTVYRVYIYVAQSTHRFVTVWRTVTDILLEPIWATTSSSSSSRRLVVVVATVAVVAVVAVVSSSNSNSSISSSVTVAVA